MKSFGNYLKLFLFDNFSIKYEKLSKKYKNSSECKNKQLISKSFWTPVRRDRMHEAYHF